MENKTLMIYIATWCWQIMAIIFLCSSLILIGLPRTNITIILTVVTFVLFGCCEYLSFSRKQKVYKEVEDESK